MSMGSSQQEPEVPEVSAMQPCLLAVTPTEGSVPFIHTGYFVPQWYSVTQCVGIVAFPPLKTYQPVQNQEHKPILKYHKARKITLSQNTSLLGTRIFINQCKLLKNKE